MMFKTPFCRILVLILVIGFLAVTPGRFNTRTVFAFESPVTEADKTVVVRLLFEKVLAELKVTPGATILLSPRFPKDRIPEIEGIRFRQLGWDEGRNGDEFFELWEVKAKGKGVEGRFSRGNNCVQTHFTFSAIRTTGSWVVTYAGGATGFSMMDCPGCPLDSKRRYDPLGFGNRYRSKGEPVVKSPLLVTGKVEKIGYFFEKDGKGVRCTIELALEFVNRSNEPLILLQPHEGFDFWLGGTTLYLSTNRDDLAAPVYSSDMWPSIYTSEKYRKLAGLLDQPNPPEKVTRTLKPGEHLSFKASTQLVLGTENRCEPNRLGVEVGWNPLRQMTHPLFLDVSLEMWPFNVENFKKDLGWILRKRWKSFGNLYLEEKSGRYWSAHVTSEPIEIDFRKAEPIPAD